MGALLRPVGLDATQSEHSIGGADASVRQMHRLSISCRYVQSRCEQRSESQISLMKKWTFPAGLPDRGPKLTRDEYESRVMELHASGPAMPTETQEAVIRRAELDFLIDYTLGTELSQQRRDALWREQVGLDRHFPWRLLVGFLKNPTHPSDGIAKSQVRAFAKVLAPVELCVLFELSVEELEKLLT